MSFQVGSKDQHVTKQFSTLYLVGGNDINANNNCSIHKMGDLRIAGGALVKKNMRVCETLFADGNVEADSLFAKNFISGNTILINDIMEKEIDQGINIIGNIRLDSANYFTGNFLGNITLKGSLDITDQLAVFGNALFQESVIIDKNLIVESSTVIGNNLSVEGDTNLNGNLTVEEGLILSLICGDLTIKGNLDILKDLNVQTIFVDQIFGKNSPINVEDELIMTLQGARIRFDGGIAIGNNTSVATDSGITIGRNSTSVGARSISLGFSTVSSGSQSVAIGYQAIAGTTNHVSIGTFATTTGAAYQGCISIGYNANCQSFNGIAIGSSAYVQGGTSNTIVLGANLDSTANDMAVASSTGGNYKFISMRRGSASSTSVCNISNNEFYYVSSSMLLKKNIRNMESMLDTVMKLRPVRFIPSNTDNEEDNGGIDNLGFIAEEMMEVIPEVITFNYEGTNKTIEYLGISQTQLVSVLTKAIQELKVSLDNSNELIGNLTARIDVQNTIIGNLTSRIETLESYH